MQLTRSPVPDRNVSYYLEPLLKLLGVERWYPDDMYIVRLSKTLKGQ